MILRKHAKILIFRKNYKLVMSKESVYFDFIMVYNNMISADSKTLEAIVFFTNFTKVDFSNSEFNIKFVKVQKNSKNSFLIENASEIKMHMEELPSAIEVSDLEFVRNINSLILNCRDDFKNGQSSFINEGLKLSFCGIPCLEINFDRDIIVFVTDIYDKLNKIKKNLIKNIEYNSDFDILESAQKIYEAIANDSIENLENEEFGKTEKLIFSINRYMGFLRQIIEKRNVLVYPEVFLVFYNNLINKNNNVQVYNLYDLFRKHISSVSSRIEFINNNLLDGVLYYKLMFLNKEKAINFLDRVGDIVIASYFTGFDKNPIDFLYKAGIEVENSYDIKYENFDNLNKKIKKYIKKKYDDCSTQIKKIDKKFLSIISYLIQKNKFAYIYSSIQRGFCGTVIESTYQDIINKKYVLFFLDRFFKKYGDSQSNITEMIKDEQKYNELKEMALIIRDIPTFKDMKKIFNSIQFHDGRNDEG